MGHQKISNLEAFEKCSMGEVKRTLIENARYEIQRIFQEFEKEITDPTKIAFSPSRITFVSLMLSTCIQLLKVLGRILILFLFLMNTAFAFLEYCMSLKLNGKITNATRVLKIYI